MRIVNTKKIYLSSASMTLACLCFLSSSAAFCQTLPNSQAPQKWADPGAIEKAKTQAITQDMNKTSSTSPTLPTTTGPVAERKSASPIQRQAKDARYSSISGGETLNKNVRHLSSNTGPHQISSHEVEASHPKLTGTTHASAAGRKLAISPGHAPVTKKAQGHALSIAAPLPARSKNSHTLHDNLTSKENASGPAAATMEFDPIYGFSNIVSVAY